MSGCWLGCSHIDDVLALTVPTTKGLGIRSMAITPLPYEQH
jgi:hypothetical protein